MTALTAGPKTVTEVARATKLSKPTAFRLLASLGYRSLVIKDEVANVYMLGPGVLRLVNGASGLYESVALVAGEPLARLAEATGETAVVHARIGHSRVCVAQCESDNAVRYTIDIGAVAPLHVGSSGKVLLAFMDEADANRLLDAVPLTRITPATVTSRAALKEQLAEVRRTGFAYSVGERTPGAAGLTVPIHGKDGFVASLSIIGPADRMGQGAQDRYLRHLRRAAGEIEAALRRTSRASAHGTAP